MPLKQTGTGDLREIDRFDGGVGWIAHPDETMERARQALGTPEGVLVVDPVDAEGVDDLVAPLGEVAAVVILLDRHQRDAVAVAERHDVPVAAPAWMRGVEGRDGARPVALSSVLEGTGYESRTVVDTPLWQEAALFEADSGTLVVAEALGTATYFRAGDERVGVHPFLRLAPPRVLAGVEAERLRVGHGSGLGADAATAIDDAIRGSRSRVPRLLVENVAGLVRG